MVSADDLIALAARFDEGAGVLRTFESGGSNGASLLSSAISAADEENSLPDRAARLALCIQANQPFRNANTRTATASIYLLLMSERQQSMKAKAYQAYGMVGYYGPRYADNQLVAMEALSSWILKKTIGSPNVEDRYDIVLADLADMDQIVENIRNAEKDGENNNEPDLRALLSQKQSWRAHHGY
jgi:prophage maintenance system killer protein